MDLFLLLLLLLVAFAIWGGLSIHPLLFLILLVVLILFLAGGRSGGYWRRW